MKILKLLALFGLCVALIQVRSVQAQWTVEQSLPSLGDQYQSTENGTFGIQMDQDGEYAVISTDQSVAPDSIGKVIVYHFEGGSWNEQQVLIALDTASTFSFGYGLCIRDTVLVVGAPSDTVNGHLSGSAYVFMRSGEIWTQTQKIVPSDGSASSAFGRRCVISGQTMLISADVNDDLVLNGGKVYVYQLENGTWTEHQTLFAFDAEEQDNFGAGLAIAGDHAIIGADRDGDDGYNSGSAYAFKRINGQWEFQYKIWAPNGDSGNRFGANIEMTDSLAMINRKGYNDNNGSYVVHCYRLTNDTWVEFQTLTVTDGASGDRFGESMSIDGELAILGAKGDDDYGSGSGSAYIFSYGNGIWTENFKLLPPDGGINNYFGSAVGLSEHGAIVTSDRYDNGFEDSGIAYAFSQIPLSTAHEPESCAQLLVNPNPTSSTITLQSQTPLSEAWLTDLAGRRLMPLQPNGTQWNADLSQLPTGMYLVEALSEDGKRGVRKVVKE